MCRVLGSARADEFVSKEDAEQLLSYGVQLSGDSRGSRTRHSLLSTHHALAHVKRDSSACDTMAVSPFSEAHGQCHLAIFGGPR